MMNLGCCASAQIEAFSGGCSRTVICMTPTWAGALMVGNVFSCCAEQTSESDQHSSVTLEKNDQ